MIPFNEDELAKMHGALLFENLMNRLTESPSRMHEGREGEKLEGKRCEGEKHEGELVELLILCQDTPVRYIKALEDIIQRPGRFYPSEAKELIDWLNTEAFMTSSGQASDYTKLTVYDLPRFFLDEMPNWFNLFVYSSFSNPNSIFRAEIKNFGMVLRENTSLDLKKIRGLKKAQRRFNEAPKLQWMVDSEQNENEKAEIKEHKSAESSEYKRAESKEYKSTKSKEYKRAESKEHKPAEIKEYKDCIFLVKIPPECTLSLATNVFSEYVVRTHDINSDNKNYAWHPAKNGLFVCEEKYILEKILSETRKSQKEPAQDFMLSSPKKTLYFGTRELGTSCTCTTKYRPGIPFISFIPFFRKPEIAIKNNGQHDLTLGIVDKAALLRRYGFLKE